MEVADLSSRELDKPLNLSIVERGHVEEISRSPLWWKEPTEDVLGLGGFSPFWASLVPPPSLLVDGVERGLRERLVWGPQVKVEGGLPVRRGAHDC